jgi:threonine/homoserine/homoserine lactone efflux protein
MVLFVLAMMTVSASFWLLFVYTLDRPVIRRSVERSQLTVNRIFGALVLLMGLRVAMSR